MNELNGDKEKAFLNAYDQYSDAIFRHCYYRMFDEDRAKDVLQEVFCRTWKYVLDGKEIDNMRAFLYRVANNVIIDEARKKKPLSLNEIMERGFSPKLDVRESIENYFAHKEVLKVIQSLNEKYKDAIIMKYVNGLSAEEIADVTGESQANIYIRLHRGLKQVKDILSKGKQV